jgi:hypothetical protein
VNVQSTGSTTITANRIYAGNCALSSTTTAPVGVLLKSSGPSPVLLATPIVRHPRPGPGPVPRPVDSRGAVLLGSVNRFAKPVLAPTSYTRPRHTGGGRARTGRAASGDSVPKEERRGPGATGHHRRRGRACGRLEDGGLVRVQQPGPAEHGHRQPHPRHRPGARLPARPGRPDADPAADRGDRHHGPAGLLGHFSPPFFAFNAGIATAEEHATACTSSRRCTARCRGRSTGRRSTGSWRSA